MSTTIPENYLPVANQRVGSNPMLPATASQVAQDSQYAAQEAQLRAAISKQYADILQLLGYTDDQGNFIPGQVSTLAGQQQADYQRSSDLAGQGVTEQSQREGTLFSGRRATETARAQFPFQQAIAQLGVDVPLQLAQLHEQASGLVDTYTLQNNLLLAELAQRQAAAQVQQPSGGLNAQTPGTPSSGGGDVSTPSTPAGPTVPGLPGPGPTLAPANPVVYNPGPLQPQSGTIEQAAQALMQSYVNPTYQPQAAATSPFAAAAQVLMNSYANPPVQPTQQPKKKPAPKAPGTSGARPLY